ncbi:MAG TPA: phosphatase PAP2 family protein [Modestobacter sp.]|jgi:membrane-associated phospholipid phosphatase|nr:phosphatase PAP2 family protein [Modestobacter sp.]
MTDRRSLAWCLASLAAWSALLGMVLTREGLAEDDAPVLRWLVGHRSGAATTVLTGVSDSVVDAAAAAGVAGVVLLIAVRGRSVWPLVTLAGAVGGSVVLAELVKAVVGRARPGTATMLGTPETGSGFPSAHTLVMTALVGAGALVVWRATRAVPVRAGAVVLAVLTAVAMGASRLYLGDHWLTDVLASYALAGVVLTVVAALTAPGSVRDRWTATLPRIPRATRADSGREAAVEGVSPSS